MSAAIAVSSAQTKSLPRVYVHTDQSNGDAVLKERQQSVKDLQSVFAERTQGEDEDKADGEVEVLERTRTVPKVRIGTNPPNSGLPGVGVPSRTVRLRVRATRGDEKQEFTNKSTPFENDRGWQAAAEDVE